MERIATDLTVIGGGMSGMCAALAAARHGLKVALVNDRPVLGGNISSEIGVGIGGAAGGGKGDSASVYSREGGIIEEIRLTISHFGESRPMRDAALMDIFLREPNISLFHNTHIHEVFTDGDRITAVQGVQLGSERTWRFESPLFVDATGDGTVGFRAGADFRMGREAREEYGESYAPEKADNLTMGACLVFHSVDVGHKVVYHKPAFAHDFASMEFFRSIGKPGLFRDYYRVGNTFHTLWWVEFGGTIDAIRDNEEVSLELRRLIYGLWDYIKNGGDFDDVDNLELEFVSPIVGKRESRRLMGDYVLSQNDILAQRDFEDAVTYGGWPMDVHTPGGIYDADQPASTFYYVPAFYPIPYRCLYSRNVRNLFMAGRDISVTHIALGSTRLVATCGCEGQAVGTAAYLCTKHGKLPRELAQAPYIGELVNTLLLDDQPMVERREDVGYAAGCRLSASSVHPYENLPTERRLPLDKRYGLALPLSADRLDEVQVQVHNAAGEPARLGVQIWKGERRQSYAAKIHVKDLAVEIAPGFDGWVTIPVAEERGTDEKIHLIFDESEALSLYAAAGPLTGAVTYMYKPTGLIFVGLDQVHPNHCDDSIAFRGLRPAQGLYGPENVVNGYSRPCGLPGLWISGETPARQEQWLQLDLPQPTDLHEVILTFNTTLETDGIFGLPQLIRDYRVEITDQAGHTETMRVTGNYLRYRRHPVEMAGAQRVRIVAEACHEEPSFAEIYSVKLF